jgi:hypothetical protein
MVGHLAPCAEQLAAEFCVVLGGVQRAPILGRSLTSHEVPSLVARVTLGCLFDLGHDAAEVVALRRLERRELLERLQVFEPRSKANRSTR